MVVTLHDSEIRIQVNEGSLHHKIIDNFVQKYFSNVLSLSSTVIIYHREYELSKKKYFLNWLHSAYKKVEPTVKESFLTDLQNSMKLPVRIRIMGKKNILNGIKLRITFPEKHVMRFSIDAINDVPKTYFINVFKKAVLSSNRREIDIKTTVFSVQELRKILDRDKVLGLPITFVYSQIIINRLFTKLDARLSGQESEKKTKSRFKYKRHKHNHVPIKEEHVVLLESYKILECRKEDPLDVIKRKYLKLAKAYHPDTVHGQPEDVIKEYTAKFQQIRDAFSTIQNNLGKRKAA